MEKTAETKKEALFQSYEQIAQLWDADRRRTRHLNVSSDSNPRSRVLGVPSGVKSVIPSHDQDAFDPEYCSDWVYGNGQIDRGPNGG